MRAQPALVGIVAVIQNEEHTNTIGFADVHHGWVLGEQGPILNFEGSFDSRCDDQSLTAGLNRPTLFEVLQYCLYAGVDDRSGLWCERIERWYAMVSCSI